MSSPKDQILRVLLTSIRYNAVHIGRGCLAVAKAEALIIKAYTDASACSAAPTYVDLRVHLSAVVCTLSLIPSPTNVPLKLSESTEE